MQGGVAYFDRVTLGVNIHGGSFGGNHAQLGGVFYATGDAAFLQIPFNISMPPKTNLVMY